MQKSSVNKVILVGHLGNNPEVRYTPSGTSTANFSIATNEYWIDGEKEKKEHTEWHNIVAWNKLADFAAEYLQKGQLIYIEGRLHTRVYQDKNEVQHRITEILSNVITPLEWKVTIKKENSLSKEVIDQGNKSNDEPKLPF